MPFKFERFEAWRRAIDFADAMFELADGLPQRVQFSLGEQLRREGVTLKTAVITYPEGFPQMLKMSDAEFAGELSFLAAAKLYELGRVSSGKAARLAGLERVEFLHRLAQLGVPAINLRDEEIEAEIDAAREIAA